MASYVKTVTAATVTVLAALCAASLLVHGRTWTAALAGAAFTVVVQMSCLLALRRARLIALAVSLIPGVLVWMWLESGKIFILTLALAAFLTAGVVGRKADLPDVRESTDKWVGTLLVGEILLFSALAAFGGLL